MGEPDPFRLKRHEEIKGLVGRIIGQKMSRAEAEMAIDDEAVRMPVDERKQFTDVVWEELESIHEGNYAGYRVRPSTFERWLQGWE